MPKPTNNISVNAIQIIGNGIFAIPLNFSVLIFILLSPLLVKGQHN